MTVTLTRDSSTIQDMSEAIIDICDHLMIVVRSMMKQLHPLILKNLGLKATLEDLIHHWEARTSYTTFSLFCDESIDEIDQTIAIQIYRVIHEGLTNIIRHANAQHATINLNFRTQANTLHLIMTDNGQGFDQD